MAFFKTAQEKEIEAQMERDEQLQAFDDRIQELKGKLTEYATLAAQAEINGDNRSCASVGTADSLLTGAQTCARRNRKQREGE